MQAELGHSRRPAWTPRLSRAFVNALRVTLNEDGSRRWSDPTLNRILAHLKTFASWVHRQQPFPLGSPLANLAALSTPTVLALERALTLVEQRQLLDAADLLVEIGGGSRDRRAHGPTGERPRRKGYRPYRNRAIVYTLLGTGMRRAAIRNLNLAAVDFDRRLVTVTQKGGAQQTYHISREALAAISDYLSHERADDAAGTSRPALFLAAASHTKGNGRLSVRSLNAIWTAVASLAALPDGGALIALPVLSGDPGSDYGILWDLASGDSRRLTAWGASGFVETFGCGLTNREGRRAEWTTW